MSDFGDITGWREELEAFKATDEGAAYFDFGRYGGVNAKEPVPIIPASTLLHLAELHFKYPEIHDALTAYADWQQQVDIIDQDINATEEDFAHLITPSEALSTLTSFREWYAFKTRTPYYSVKLDSALYAAYWVVTGKFPSLRSDECIRFLERTAEPKS